MCRRRTLDVGLFRHSCVKAIVARSLEVNSNDLKTRPDECNKATGGDGRFLESQGCFDLVCGSQIEEGGAAWFLKAGASARRCFAVLCANVETSKASRAFGMRLAHNAMIAHDAELENGLRNGVIAPRGQ